MLIYNESQSLNSVLILTVVERIYSGCFVLTFTADGYVI